MKGQGARVTGPSPLMKKCKIGCFCSRCRHHWVECSCELCTGCYLDSRLYDEYQDEPPCMFGGPFEGTVRSEDIDIESIVKYRESLYQEEET